jgi:hypothetical protein
MNRTRIPLLLCFSFAACGGDGGKAADADADTAYDVWSDTHGLDVSDTDPGDTEPAETDGDADAEPDGSGDVDPDVVVVPAESVINEHRDPVESPVEDGTYPSEETRYYRRGDGMPDVEPTAIVALEGRVWAGTTAGLAVFDPETDAFVAHAPSVTGRVDALADRAVLADTWNRLAAIVDGEAVLISTGSDSVNPLPEFESTLTVIATNGYQIWVSPGTGLWRAEGEGWVEDERFSGLEVHAVANLADGDLVVATSDGLRIAGALSGDVTAALTGTSLLDAATCADDSVATISADALHVWSSAGVATTEAGPGGLPTTGNRRVACGYTNLHFVGHDVGATAVSANTGRRDHYTSNRWMLGVPATDVATGLDDTRWIASTDGITHIDLVARTLAEKAADRHATLEDRFRRLDGFISSERALQSWWSWEGSYLPDKDNDGLWTQMMIGAWAYAYGVTGDDAYCDAARRSIANMLRLVEFPCETFSETGLECGFIARSYVRDDEGVVYDSKLEQENWHPVDGGDGHTYRWKDDTSSDELDGHTYGFPLYFDLCATEEEREVLAATFAQITDYIIDGDYLLLDLDGEKTTHGHWDPAHVSSCVDGFASCRAGVEICGGACFGGGYLNGMQILGQLLVAWHMTGEDRYYLEYERLIREHRYDEVITNVAQVMTLHNASIENHSDHELMMLAYHSLIRYEPNADRRERWVAAMLEMYEAERVERHPMWVPFVAGLTGTALDVEEAVQSLREMPWDGRDWRVDNTHRVDFTVNPAADRFGDPQFLEVPPYDEMGYMWWNGNPHEIVQGGSREEMAPTHYLIAYWAMRYYGLLE